MRNVGVLVFTAGSITLAQVQCYNCDAVPRPGNISYPERSDNAKLPDGRSQKEAILKTDHEMSLKEADEVLALAAALKADLEQEDRHILSVATLKKLDDIQKLVKRIRNRMKRL